jgi:hypothetical protein
LLSPRQQRLAAGATGAEGWTPDAPMSPDGMPTPAVDWRLRELQTQVPPGMFLQPRVIRSAHSSLLVDFLYAGLADG